MDIRNEEELVSFEEQSTDGWQYSLRPRRLSEYIGQDKIKDNLSKFIQAALSRGEALDHVLLYGPPGLGKTTLAGIIANEMGANFRQTSAPAIERQGDLASLLTNLQDHDVLFIDEIHTLVGAGGGEGAMDAANLLKPALARGELRAIGATTLNEYQKYFEKDKALERRFQMVKVDEPDELDAISILRGLKEKYENHHHVRIQDDACIAAVQLSERYISDRFLPDKAIDLMDEAAAKLRMERDSVPEELDEMERSLKQKEIERQAILRENDTEKIALLEKEIAELKDKVNAFRAR